ncbi:MAG: PEP-CTERM sorting domain-containing protein [Gemmatimonas sp.]
MKFRFAATAAFLATTAAANTVSAQQGVDPQGGTWQSGWTPGTQVDEFWNRTSDDGANCNIGYFVQGGFGPCMNQNPGVFPAPLGWSNATYLSFTPASTSDRTVVKFTAGTYQLDFLGQVAGATPSRFVGVSSADGSNTLNYTFGAAPESYTFIADRDWELFLQPFLPTGQPTFYSNDPFTRQFVVFANSNGGNGDFAGQWLVGAEDNGCSEISEACPRLSDYDYNDALIRVSSVPEPSTYALMTVGLIVVGGAARRRRQAVKA